MALQTDAFMKDLRTEISPNLLYSLKYDCDTINFCVAYCDTEGAGTVFHVSFSTNCFIHIFYICYSFNKKILYAIFVYSWGFLYTSSLF